MMLKNSLNELLVALVFLQTNLQNIVAMNDGLAAKRKWEEDAGYRSNKMVRSNAMKVYPRKYDKNPSHLDEGLIKRDDGSILITSSNKANVMRDSEGRKIIISTNSTGMPPPATHSANSRSMVRHTVDLLELTDESSSKNAPTVRHTVDLLKLTDKPSAKNTQTIRNTVDLSEWPKDNFKHSTTGLSAIKCGQKCDQTESEEKNSHALAQLDNAPSKDASQNALSVSTLKRTLEEEEVHSTFLKSKTRMLIEGQYDADDEQEGTSV